MQFYLKDGKTATLVLCIELLSNITEHYFLFQHFLCIFDETINQAEIPKNLTRYLNKYCRSSSPKPCPLLEKMVKDFIIRRKTASIKIPLFPSPGSTFTFPNMQL